MSDDVRAEPVLSADLLDEFTRIAAEYRARLDRLMKDVASQGAVLRDLVDQTDAMPGPLEALIGSAHRIAGSAGTFGYPAISDAALVLEQTLRGIATHQYGDGLPAIVGQQIEQFAALWRQEQGRATPALVGSGLLPDAGSHGPEPQSEAGRGRPCLFLVDDDNDLAAHLSHQIGQFGYEVRVFVTLADAEAALHEVTPAAAVFDLMFPDGELAGADLAVRFAARVPVIMLTSRTDFTARLAAVRAGCTAYLVKPVEIHDLINWLDNLTGRRPEPGERVLIVDDDTHLAETYAGILRGAGMWVVVVSEPWCALDALAEFQPDLILMDIYMPVCTGIELARVIRQHRQYLGMPIVFLSVEGDISRQLAALQPGGDEFLTKPIRPDHLVRAIRQRAERARALRTVMESDSLTGLLNHARTKARLITELARAGRQDQPR